MAGFDEAAPSARGHRTVRFDNRLHNDTRVQMPEIFLHHVDGTELRDMARAVQ